MVVKQAIAVVLFVESSTAEPLYVVVGLCATAVADDSVFATVLVAAVAPALAATFVETVCNVCSAEALAILSYPALP